MASVTTGNYAVADMSLSAGKATPRPPRQSNHFANLDTLRWFSALAVIVTHVELIKAQHGIVNSWSHVVVQNLGPVGVYFF
jgi:peptidoglycan/LPS O-acetylase OafA/YrhL